MKPCKCVRVKVCVGLHTPGRNVYSGRVSGSVLPQACHFEYTQDGTDRRHGSHAIGLVYTAFPCIQYVGGGCMVAGAARGDEFSQVVERGRHLLPAAVRHHHWSVYGARRVLLQDQHRGQTSQGLRSMYFSGLVSVHLRTVSGTTDFKNKIKISSLQIGF